MLRRQSSTPLPPQNLIVGCERASTHAPVGSLGAHLLQLGAELRHLLLALTQLPPQLPRRRRRRCPLLGRALLMRQPAGGEGA
jgi:hypothetical protein